MLRNVLVSTFSASAMPFLRCCSIGAKKVKPGDEKPKPVEEKPFIFLDVSILREYLAVELDLRTNTPFDLERAIDDWIFLIFFVGNDFLPHLPSLEIREGAIDTLLAIWKKEFDNMGGYVTNHGQLDLEKAQYILSGLAAAEDDIFRRRKESKSALRTRRSSAEKLYHR